MLGKDTRKEKVIKESELGCSLEYSTRVASNHCDVNSINSSSSKSNMSSRNAHWHVCRSNNIMMNDTRSIL